MEKLHQARYYDGVSSQAFTVSVSLGEKYLHIDFTDAQGNPQRTSWEKEAIHEVQYARSILSLRYGNEFPYQQLDITDQEFIAEYGQHFHRSVYQRVAHSGRTSTMLFILGGFLGLLVLGYFFVLPFMADLFARSFPRSYEIAMGQQLYESVLAGEEIDEQKTEAINRFFSQLHVEGDYPVRITVVEKDIPNAFALPGGGIVVYDKILHDMDSCDELAALLAHEYSHVQLKHATRNIFRSVSGYLFISIVLGDLSGISAVVIQNAQNLSTLQYGRSLEHEADENGLNILRENRVGAQGMERLFRTLKKENDVEMIELLSSHPDIDSRIGFVETFRKEHPYEPQPNDSLDFYFRQLR